MVVTVVRGVTAVSGGSGSSGSGSVSGVTQGSASVVDQAIARYSGTTGTVIQGYTVSSPMITNSGVLVMLADIVFQPTGAGSIGGTSSGRPTNVFASATISAGGNIAAGGNCTIAGSVITAGLQVNPTTGAVTWINSTRIIAPSNGSIAFNNNVQTGFISMIFGSSLSTSPALFVNGANLVLRNGDSSADSSITVSSVSINARVSMSGTFTTGGTTGAQTINKPSGAVNFAALASGLTVSNSLVTATGTVIMANVAGNDTTLKTVAHTQAAGVFTLIGNAAATAETRVDFVVINMI